MSRYPANVIHEKYPNIRLQVSKSDVVHFYFCFATPANENTSIKEEKSDETENR